MKITIISAIGLSLFRSVEGSLGALVSNPRISTLGHAEVVSEPLEGSNLQRALINDAEFKSAITSVTCDVRVDDGAGSTDFAIITCSVIGIGDQYSKLTASVTSKNNCQSPYGYPINVGDPSTGLVRTRMSANSAGYNLADKFEVRVPNSEVNSQYDTVHLFCLRTSVTDKADYVQYWKGTWVNFRAISSGTVTTSLTTTTFNGMDNIETETEQLSFTVRAYRCDGNGSEQSPPPPLVLGENFFICIEPNGDGGNLKITDVFGQIEKDGVNTFLLYTNTFKAGYNTQKFVIATRLPLEFFSDSKGALFRGQAYVTINADNDRRLVRIMQEDTTEEKSAEFSMDIAVVAGIPGSASGASAIKSTVAMAVFFGAGAVFAALF